MVDRNKILSDLSKFAVDAMSTFSGVKEEIETIVSLRCLLYTSDAADE